MAFQVSDIATENLLLHYSSANINVAKIRYAVHSVKLGLVKYTNLIGLEKFDEIDEILYA